jgi:hypothetical protein
VAGEGKPAFTKGRSLNGFWSMMLNYLAKFSQKNRTPKQCGQILGEGGLVAVGF